MIDLIKIVVLLLVFLNINIFASTINNHEVKNNYLVIVASYKNKDLMKDFIDLKLKKLNLEKEIVVINYDSHSIVSFGWFEQSADANNFIAKIKQKLKNSTPYKKVFNKVFSAYSNASQGDDQKTFIVVGDSVSIDGQKQNKIDIVDENISSKVETKIVPTLAITKLESNETNTSTQKEKTINQEHNISIPIADINISNNDETIKTIEVYPQHIQVVEEKKQETTDDLPYPKMKNNLLSFDANYNMAKENIVFGSNGNIDFNSIDSSDIDPYLTYKISYKTKNEIFNVSSYSYKKNISTQLTNDFNFGNSTFEKNTLYESSLNYQFSSIEYLRDFDYAYVGFDVLYRKYEFSAENKTKNIKENIDGYDIFPSLSIKKTLDLFGLKHDLNVKWFGFNDINFLDASYDISKALFNNFEVYIGYNTRNLEIIDSNFYEKTNSSGLNFGLRLIF